MSSIVPVGWNTVSLAEGIDILSGYSFDSSSFTDDSSKVGLIRIRDLVRQKVATYFDGAFDDNYLIRKGDVLIGMDGDFNIVKWNSAPGLLNQRICKVTVAGEIFDLAYLYQDLQKDLLEINNQTGSTTVKHLSVKDIRGIHKSYPPLPEQKKIASILTSVDEVIENTQKQIDKLQDLKKATMNELLTKGIGHTEFKDSELGQIPKCWEVRSLSEVSELSRGKFSHRPRNDPAFYDGDFPFLQTGDIPTDNLDISHYSQSLNEKGLQVSRLFPKGTLVITIAATIGEVASLTFDSCFPDSLVGITANESLVRQYFLLFCLRFRKQVLIQEAPESAQKNLNLDILNPFQVAVPPLDEQRAIESTLLSLQKHIEKNKTKLSQTQSLKKSLMQDLLTGKIRVTVN